MSAASASYLTTPFLFKVAGQTFTCSMGKNGLRSEKKEGDGTTPIGEFPTRQIFYRPDRIELKELKSDLPLIALQPDDGWCDDVNSTNYNKYIKLPCKESHEQLWRTDDVYDIIVVIGYNDNPIEKGKGSAIFLHIARKNYTGTSGCIGLEKSDLLKVLSYLTPHSKIKINSNGTVELTAPKLANEPKQSTENSLADNDKMPRPYAHF